MWQTIETVYTNPAAGDVVAHNSPDRIALVFDWFGTDRVFLSTLPSQSNNAGVAISSSRPPLQLWFRQTGVLVSNAWYCGTGNTGSLTVIEVLYRDDSLVAPPPSGVPLLPVGPPGGTTLTPLPGETMEQYALRFQREQQRGNVPLWGFS